MKFIIAIVLLFALAVIVLMLRSGPRVTHIEHRRDEIDERDHRKDGDDA